MARQRRLNEPGTYHHITARGVDRCRIFLDDGDRRQFLALLQESHDRFGCRILAFCLMDNHIHLTLLDEHGTLSKTLHFLNGVYAKKFNLRHERTGHLFERRFWSSMLDSDAYLSTCVTYVHRNPLEAGLVSRIEDHRWSSYPSYIGARSAPTFLDMSTVLNHYGNDVGRLRWATEQPPDDSGIYRQLSSHNPPAVITTCVPTTPSPPPTTHSQQTIPLETVMLSCAQATRVNVLEITRRTPGRRNEARNLVAFVAHRHAGHGLKDIATALNLTSSAAVSLASQRFADRLDETTTRTVNEVLRSLNLPERTC